MIKIDAMDKFSDNPEENLRMENEFLKMKIAAQFGGDFGAMKDLPPEVENQFLKNILQFESTTSDKPSDLKKVKEIIGAINFEPAIEIPDSQIAESLQTLLINLRKYNFNVDFLADYPERMKYVFITEELMEHEIDTSFMVPEMEWNFIYEEFHPNHAYEIEQQVKQFVESWFERKVEAYGHLLADVIPVDRGKVVQKDTVIKKIANIFDSFSSFEKCAYHISQVSYDLNEADGTGLAFAEGFIKFDGILDNGESVHFEGPMKLYFALESYYWDVMFFFLPGFTWDNKD